ncbi:glutamic acid-rich protein isoform X2 [Bombina bombina]|uniref:glutamic acid-rich protein isoform X2 n=1 Tax=Bombina bombina TaxID=8345 RepID=UPI00235A4D5B|nr:glutamic acid-rich protein isoform X2 [Bombina bombina]
MDSNDAEELEIPSIPDEENINNEQIQHDESNEAEEQNINIEIEQQIQEDEDLEQEEGVEQNEEVEQEEEQVHSGTAAIQEKRSTDEMQDEDSASPQYYDWIPEDDKIWVNKKDLLEVLLKAEIGLISNYSTVRKMRMRYGKN